MLKLSTQKKLIIRCLIVVFAIYIILPTTIFREGGEIITGEKSFDNLYGILQQTSIGAIVSPDKIRGYYVYGRDYWNFYRIDLDIIDHKAFIASLSDIKSTLQLTHYNLQNPTDSYHQKPKNIPRWWEVDESYRIHDLRLLHDSDNSWMNGVKFFVSPKNNSLFIIEYDF